MTSIGWSAFYGCSGLTSITIPESVTSIGKYAFYNCSGLTSVNIPEATTSVGEAAFSGCSGLTSITIPNSVTSIGDFAFSGCSGLSEITIPNSVTSISDFAFHNCESLTSVISLIEEPFEISSNVFEVVDFTTFTTNFTSATLLVPAGTKSKYESKSAWNKFTNIVEMELSSVKSAQTDVTVEEMERYNISGQRISAMQKGLNIVKMSDGTTKKVMFK